MTWLLEQISIEGFRGINNAGIPLQLKLHPDKVNSISAPNAVGKSSIFDAVTYALTGGIPKLDNLPAAERGASYYLNRFHPANLGTISLSLKSSVSGAGVKITVTRDKIGTRTVTTSDGSDGNALLAELNREFVLLDAKTFKSFIDESPINRGRSFSGLLGLGNYSSLRQSLQALSRTLGFNNHFQVSLKSGEKQMLQGQIAQERKNIQSAFQSLAGQELGAEITNAELRVHAHTVLHDIPLIKAKCAGKSFDDISPDDCLVSVRDAEGGPDRERLSQLLQQESGWRSLIADLPSAAILLELVELIGRRDAALSQTKGDVFFRLYKAAEQILVHHDWHDETACPACDRNGDSSVLEHTRAKIGLYSLVEEISERLTEVAGAIDWSKLIAAEKATVNEGESFVIREANERLGNNTITQELALKLQVQIEFIQTRAGQLLAATTAQKDDLEKKLPASMVDITEKIEACRRLQLALKNEEASNSRFVEITDELNCIERLRSFLTEVSRAFSLAETEASVRRLAAVEPLCREFFKKIIFDPIVPAIARRAGAEDLLISLASFYDRGSESALSLLSESHRNALAISVYLAAAALYGKSPKFLILDDVTSSLDAGHQFYLMEVIRTLFSRPTVADGPQVIILSHDTLLEKYFNRNGTTAVWSHQRIEGTPRTAVLPLADAVTRIRDITLGLLRDGKASEAAPWIRQYLEFVLDDVITRCHIPVPMDIALNDDRHMTSHLFDAIDSQIKLHAQANSLILEPTQIQGMNSIVTTITTNFLSHWSTGQTQAFSAGALVGVMEAIDKYAECFKYEPAPGAIRKYYKSLSRR